MISRSSHPIVYKLNTTSDKLLRHMALKLHHTIIHEFTLSATS